MPCGHCDRLAMQAEEPVRDEYSPAAHKLHELCDVALVNEPGEHPEQLPCPVFETVPAGHAVQFELPIAE